MKRFTVIILLTLFVLQGLEAQSTWRGQAEVLSAGSVPTEGFFASSNEFPKNSILSIESYRSKKTVQVRISGALPSGMTCLVALSPKAASALDISMGDSVLVGVQLVDSIDKKTPSSDVAANPDPDVNPLAGAGAAPLAATTPTPVPPLKSEPITSTDPATGTALAVAPEGAADSSAAPGKKVFLPPREAAPVASDAGSPLPLPALADPNAAPAASTAPVAPAVPSATVQPQAPAAESAPIATVPSAAPASDKPAVAAEAPVEPSKPAVADKPAEASPVNAASEKVPVLPPASRVASYVSTPAKLQGEVLGRVALTDKLEKGRPYVQLASFADEKSLLAALDNLKSYVPLSIVYGGSGKSSYRLVADAGSNAQLGILLMHFKSQGFRQAAVVKG